MRQLVEAFAEAERLRPVAAVGNDGFGSALVQLLAQFGAVVGLVAEHAFRWLGSANEALCDRTIVCFASGQQDGDEAPSSIREWWIFVLRPPRERPTACFCSPLFRPLPSGVLSRG